jgi:ABC-2 type transport system permease protein
MNAFATMCRIEILKLRRTLALWMVLIAPAVVVLLQMMIWVNNRSAFDVDVDLWLSFLTNVLSMWAIFMLPLFAALIVALVYHIDHSSQGWLRLFVLPVPRWTVPAAKLTIVTAMVVAATVVLVAGSLAGTLAAQMLNARIVLPDEIPLGTIALRSAKMLVASLIVVVIQNAVSLRFSSVPVSLGVGITGTFVALFATSWKYGPYYPWLMALHTIHGKEDVAARILWISPTLAILLAAATLVYATRRAPAEYQ